MDYEQLNKLIGVPVMLAWAAMIFAPRFRGTRWLLHSDAIQLGIAGVYGALLVPHVAQVTQAFRSLAGMSALMADPKFMLGGWIHYLAFDLFVGRVVLADSQRRGIPHLAVVPCLVLTFMFGPLGYLLYALVRAAFRRLREPVAPLPSTLPA
jgi:hypothetical protein